MPMADALTLVAVGLAISTAFHLLVLPLLPSCIREKASRYKMRLRMHVMSTTVSMEMISKAAGGSGPDEPAGEVQERAAGHLREAGLDVSGNDLSLEARVNVEGHTLTMSVRFASDGDGAFKEAEIVVGAECRYGDFEGCIAEMRDAQVLAKDALSRAGLAPDKTFRIACKLKSLPRAKAMLDSINADMITCTTPEGHAFDLYDNKVEYCDTKVHRGMMSYLKKVLAVHS